MTTKKEFLIKPDFLKRKLPGYGDYSQVKKTIKKHGLNTVCTGASCPNIGECWSQKSMTVMILGSRCSRNCLFCDVKSGNCEEVDENEPFNTAEALHELEMKYAVITSVTRDDLSDGGSSHWAKTIEAVHSKGIFLEALIPDFKNNKKHLENVFSANPEILSHNIETVPRLSKLVRPQADYQTSLEVLKYAVNSKLVTKSSMMLGMGETRDEVIEAMKDLLSAGVSILSLGQYLMPTRKHYPVTRYLDESEFESLKITALSMGFKMVESAPLVRSSFGAAAHIKKSMEFNNIF
ncbi:MAG: lipoyl synthase [Deltaproteobacteria bacterium]|nr:lipoyl synthase [Deltaproteobacteria bacterium]